ncbi:MAG: SDR family oxidoreductase [Candidatus Hinthialibacter antarcticus]|nr:SDR family oxidoreductase [Candidatus Hinthialibacter antarcticus]
MFLLVRAILGILNLMAMKTNSTILLTGATGYVGGRLLPKLVDRGYQVRCLTRRPEALQSRNVANIEIIQGNVLDEDSLVKAMDGATAAYYLVHSMGSRKRFEREDRIAAERFASAAKKADLERIIYLGGLGDSNHQLSAHLKSRHEVGRIFRESGVKTIELRASVVIGSGSLSFEMVRALTERLPVLITPRWVSVPTQPIAVNDILSYLVQSLDVETTHSRVYEIGGSDIVTYGDLMKEYARQRGLKRWMISVPVLTPYLSSLWLGLVTPIYARIGRKLIDSIRNPTIVTDETAQEDFSIRPVDMQTAVASALINEDKQFAETRWSDALSSIGTLQDWGGVRFGSRIVDSRTALIRCKPEGAFRPIERIGGENGWYYGNFLWKIRGWIDLCFGGAGLRRGRRDPEHVRIGDALDFWRVEAVEPNRLIRLSAEMKLPGRAWLQFEVEPDSQGSIIRQTAIFDPVGLPGLLYWYALFPLHEFVFAGMLREIARRAQNSI